MGDGKVALIVNVNGLNGATQLTLDDDEKVEQLNVDADPGAMRRAAINIKPSRCSAA